jgi:hypothetical protein
MVIEQKKKEKNTLTCGDSAGFAESVKDLHFICVNATLPPLRQFPRELVCILAIRKVIGGGSSMVGGCTL